MHEIPKSLGALRDQRVQPRNLIKTDAGLHSPVGQRHLLAPRLYAAVNAVEKRTDVIEDSRVKLEEGAYLGTRPATLVSVAEEMSTYHLGFTGSDRLHVLTGARGNIQRILNGLREHVHAASEPEQLLETRAAFYRVEELLHHVDELRDEFHARRSEPSDRAAFRGVARRTSALGCLRPRGPRRRGAGRPGHRRTHASRGPPPDDDPASPHRPRRCIPGRRRREASS